MTDQLMAIRKDFSLIAELPDEQINLGDAALLIARIAYPRLDTREYQQRFDRLAQQLKTRVDAQASAGDIITEMNRILFDEQGFQGNYQDYYDPDNSYINRVLDRKLGIPITLSLVYIEVGRRAGLTVYGINLPGHFIVAVRHLINTVYIDPFNQGEMLTEDECRQRVRARYGTDAAERDDWKMPAGNKAILKRMLRNLKAIYQTLNHNMRKFEIIEWVLLLDPDSPDELRDRGLLYETLGNTQQSVKDLEHYLNVAPEADDRELIEEKIESLKNNPQWLH